MTHRKVIVAAAAAIALGAAFAAQPTSDRAGRGAERPQQRALWVPGANMLMSVNESSVGPIAPPR